MKWQNFHRPVIAIGNQSGTQDFVAFRQAGDGIAQAIKIDTVIKHEGMRQVEGRTHIAAMFGMQNGNLFGGQRIEFHFRRAARIDFEPGFCCCLYGF